jgi:dUTP pyrophosphatase
MHQTELHIEYTLVHPKALKPSYMSGGAAGADLFSCEHVTVWVNERALVPTGVCVEVPVGYEAQIRSRSGLALKHNVAVFQGIGTIDSDFRGELKVLLTNLGNKPFIIEPGNRIAQLVIAPVVRAEFYRVEALSASVRATSGWGSSGV